MKTKIVAITGLAGTALAILFFHLHSSRPSGSAVVHVENQFEFTVHAPFKDVAPLFGAWGERAWGEIIGSRSSYIHNSRATYSEKFLRWRTATCTRPG